MEASLVLGGTLDIATPGEVQSIVDKGIDGLFNRANAKRTNFRTLNASHSNASGTGTFLLDLGSPVGGFQWNLAEIIVTGATDREAPAGAVATVYMGAGTYMPTPTTVFGTPPLGALVRPALALPAVFTFGSNEPIPVKDGEHLLVIVYSPTTAMTGCSAVARVGEVKASAQAMNVL